MRKTWAPSVHRFDHWGAAECGLQLGVIQTRAQAACRNPAARSGALIFFICILFTADSVPVHSAEELSIVSASGTERREFIFFLSDY